MAGPEAMQGNVDIGCGFFRSAFNSTVKLTSGFCALKLMHLIVNSNGIGYETTSYSSSTLRTRKPAMVLKITSIILLLFLLLSLSSGSFEGSKQGISSCNSDHKDVSLTKMRKILVYELHDYDDTTANTKHDPRKRPGSGKP